MHTQELWLFCMDITLFFNILWQNSTLRHTIIFFLANDVGIHVFPQISALDVQYKFYQWYSSMPSSLTIWHRFSVSWSFHSSSNASLLIIWHRIRWILLYIKVQWTWWWNLLYFTVTCCILHCWQWIPLLASCLQFSRIRYSISLWKH